MKKSSLRLKEYMPKTSEGFGILVVALLTVALSVYLIVGKNASPSEGHGHEEGKSHEEGPKSVELSEDVLMSSQIGVDTAKQSILKQVIKVRGRITVNKDRFTQLGSRFNGTIVRINKKLGDQVKQGETVAVVEAAAARSTFEVRSGISGMVVELKAARGLFVTDKEPFITIADLSMVWAEFDVSDMDYALIKSGQKVEIHNTDNGLKTDSTLFYVSSHINEDTQSLIVRAQVNNATGEWRPGTFIEGKIFASETSVDVAIKNEAIQTIEGKSVIFVKSGDQFSQREITVARSDPDQTEIKDGIKVGEEYVTNNSFIVKSEFLKSTAAHEH